MNSKETQKIIIDLPNGMQLFAQQYPYPMHENEISIGVIKDGRDYHDLAVVRNSCSFPDSVFDVIVFDEKDGEDFTHIHSTYL